MNLPNLITMARIFLVPVFLYAVLTRYELGAWIATGLFILAAITDGVDGYLARRNNEVTRLGKFLDPLADKLLISAALIALVELDLLTTWVAIIIIGREMAVTGLRAIAAAEGTVIAAGPWGKVKTVFQIIFIVTAILAGRLPDGFWLQRLASLLEPPMLWTAVGLTIWSGIDYGMAYVRGLSTSGSSRPPRRRRGLLRRRKDETER